MSEPAKKLPYMKWYPADWRADPRLRICSLAARGLWNEMICLMHEAEPYGALVVSGAAVNEKQLASLVGAHPREVKTCLAELEAAGVFSRNDDKTIYSRRMVRDKAKAEKDRDNGKGGGNPKLRGEVIAGVNPPVKAQIPDTRKKDGADAPRLFEKPDDPDADLFRRGKQVLGENAGSLIAKLKKNKGGIAQARAVIEQASTKQNPKEYVGRVLNGAAKATTPEGEEYPDGII